MVLSVSGVLLLFDSAIILADRTVLLIHGLMLITGIGSGVSVVALIRRMHMYLLSLDSLHREIGSH